MKKYQLKFKILEINIMKIKIIQNNYKNLMILLVNIIKDYKKINNNMIYLNII